MRLFRSRAEWPYVVSLTSGWFCAAGAHDAQQIDSQVLRTEKKAVTVILRFSVAHPKAIVGDYCHFLLHSTEEEVPMLSRARWRESTAARRWGSYVQGFTAVAVLLLIGACAEEPTVAPTIVQQPQSAIQASSRSDGTNEVLRIHRFDASIAATGSFRPGQPVQLAVATRANLPTDASR